MVVNMVTVEGPLHHSMLRWIRAIFWLILVLVVFDVAHATLSGKRETTVEKRMDALEYRVNQLESGREQQIKRNAAQDEFNKVLLDELRKIVKPK
jgi:hypothetical protein